jgi:hypothetical protein
MVRRLGEGLMPFKSEAQKGWMYANKPEMAKRWQKETPKGKLPARAKKGLMKAAAKRES